jgi:glycosyltransferase involved in cell wall biosynthesis
MNIIYVQSYPVYHDLIDEQEFVEIANRDKWMPALTSQRGFPSQLWAAGQQAMDSKWQYDNLPEVPIRIFETDQREGKSRNHTSQALIASARDSKADLFVIKGMDGGIGVQLAKEVLIPKKIPFAIVIGGEWYHPIVKHAMAVLYETEYQFQQLTRRSLRFWRTVVPAQKMIRLPKSVDTRHFSPDPETEKSHDVIAAGRLISHYKNYQPLFELSKKKKVGVIGGGPMLPQFRRKYPEITWFGPVSYSEVPTYLNKGKLFFHSGFRDHYPRTISEAAACGVPPVAFDDIIHEDVIPERIGLRVSKNQFVAQICDVLDNPALIAQKSAEARSYAEKNLHHLSSLPAIREMISKFHSSRKASG